MKGQFSDELMTVLMKTNNIKRIILMAHCNGTVWKSSKHKLIV